MPPRRPVGPLSSLALARVRPMVRDHAGGVGEVLVTAHWLPGQLQAAQARRRDRSTLVRNKTQVMLPSGRVAEGEEALFGEENGEELVDFEMHEQIDQ